MIRYKMTENILNEIQNDLQRPHKFAHERVGFVGAGLALHGSDCTAIAHTYIPVEDDDYLNDPSVGAMMGPDAMFKAMAWGHKEQVALFHIHEHHGSGIPRFSDVDIRESDKFVPDFFKVRPQRPHGAIVLSKTHAYGRLWLTPESKARTIDEFHVIGAQCRKWRP
jgi:hypothetical protein